MDNLREVEVARMRNQEGVHAGGMSAEFYGIVRRAVENISTVPRIPHRTVSFQSHRSTTPIQVFTTGLRITRESLAFKLQNCSSRQVLFIVIHGSTMTQT